MSEETPEPDKNLSLDINVGGLDLDPSTDPAVLKIIAQLQSKVASLEKDKTDAATASESIEKEALLKQIEKKGFKREEFKDDSVASLKSAVKLLANTADIETKESDTLESTDALAKTDESFGHRDAVTKDWVTSQKSDT